MAQDAHDHHHIDATPYEINRPNEKVLGQSISEWTEDWWTWVLQAPFNPETGAGNPLFDTTGQYADVENDGPVFFVAGALADPEGTEVVREFTVEEGTPLLVPILNDFSFQFDTDPEPQEATINKELASWKQSVTDLFVEIDGVPVQHPQSYFLKTDFFSPGMPEEDSLLDFLYGGQEFNSADTGRAAGYWIMIEDLPLGEHTLHFGGTSNGVSLEVTDTIWVI